MSNNMLKKTMVFLGLAEEDLDQDQNATTAQAEQPTQAQPSARATAEKPGGARVKTERHAAVTPLRKITPQRQPVMQTMNEILTVHPTQYADAQVIAETFRDDIPVIMNLSRMTDAEAKRIIDFASGLVMGLNGQIERVTGKVFLLAPEHIASKKESDYVGHEAAPAEPEAEDEGSFFVSVAQ